MLANMLTLRLDLFAKGTAGVIGRIGATGRPGPKVQGPCQILCFVIVPPIQSTFSCTGW